ncbi:MAG: hypothetical protein COW24_05410 [Candidatus Kerfeldbacteria bacterium CG15_BIG_FIL_POST_REV_8_21_14_020_45_12]|uniref:EamA domain-containing protein n=1 Tax=Candidatus Kerfeldbacteria bacterium CG15_BIG_FIL_POST_REV_8_21_14_020_45_12 TaxID=2014247 RepID=A0A2M7H2G4_9BACT|nr:MAG: hypothetical protein COW24_05410 [Candidatus Kerfeldbacteria bacterium CG15_BIG_FIL_POST_REV_8_21_14_020_45_12]PJA93402.1 MAG: hypothetical protein CO132_03535 [Candidatus Kerfeldbacteria bacterium CG_4_9_14_3_um_filter_45_8]
MLAIAVILAVLGTVIWAFLNLADDFFVNKIYLDPIEGLIISSAFASLPIFLIFFTGYNYPGLLVLIFSIAVGLFTSLGLLFYFQSLLKDFASTVVALMNLTAVFVVLLNYFIFGEQLLINQYIGIFIIIASGFLLSKKAGMPSDINLIIKMILGSFCFGIAAILEQYVYYESSFLSGIQYIAIGFLLAAIIFSISTKAGRGVLNQGLARMKKYFLLFFFFEILNLSASLLISYSISLSSASIVKVIESSQVAFVLLISVTFSLFAPKTFREGVKEVTLRKLVLILSTIIGLFLLG